MVDKLTKYCKYVLIGLLVLSVVFAILGVLDGIRMDEEYAEAVKNGELDIKKADFYDATFMFFTYVALGLTVVAILFAPIYSIIINPKSIKTIGIVFGIAGVVALVAYLLSSATLSPEYLELKNITEGTDRLIDFFMVCTYIVLGGTIAAVIYSAVSKLINK